MSPDSSGDDSGLEDLGAALEQFLTDRLGREAAVRVLRLYRSDLGHFPRPRPTSPHRSIDSIA
jgi:hypothetical protein